ncbi:MAG: hypothetical protein CMJ34_13555 [Phycisphaerae bacterium]|nr:hypothetical protein [Phycisphaerae bacterium]
MFRDLPSPPTRILGSLLIAIVITGCSTPSASTTSSKAELLRMMFAGYEADDTSLWTRHVAPDAICSWNTSEMTGEELVAALGSAHTVFRDIEVDDLRIETIEAGDGRFITPMKADWSATVIATGIEMSIPCQMWIEWEGSTIVSFQEVFDNQIVTRAMNPDPESVEGELTATAAERARVVEKAFESTDLPAAVLGVVTRDGRYEFMSHGTHGPEDDRPVDEDSLFLIASMSKAITAVAALQMVDRGLIDLDEPIAPHLPEIDELQILTAGGSPRPATEPITLRDLLRHTAGFGYVFTSPLIMADVEIDPERAWPFPDVIEEGEYDWGFGIQPRRVFESGTDWLYGRNVGVAGKLVERLSGTDLETYLRRNILGPLGMTRTGFNPSPELLADRVETHSRGALTGRPMPVPPFRPDRLESFYGGGDLYGTPRDYATFLRCLLNGGELDGVRILDSALVDLLMSDQLPEGISVSLDPMRLTGGDQRSFTGDRDDGYSLGWAIEVGGEDGLRPEGVGYWSGILNTYYTIDPERGVAVVFFSQMQPFDDVAAYELYRLHEDEVYRAIHPPTSHP